ncbi:ankyrin repeat domain-containing protein [Anaerobacillus sp. CMMVII]|uniref:M48 family metallopeptidase n=1 Tax=Anaerobacillus sp. CMMVII TaxID=2755588 RepID=UPI0021B7CA48|nr:M48 family metallopeptidase [Anaerobacillus sp. CMMVII]MCT8138035.1 ankyrin repeat domain-containing protein [Anaerobacillus sp. CMMVII]
MTSIVVVGYLLLTIVGAFIVFFFALLSFFSHIISMSHIQVNGVRLRETQFPELYEKVKELSQKMELTKIPEVYIVESGGLLNAFATKVFAAFGKNMVVLYSDFVDISIESKGNEIDYVIAHELAHIKRNHIVKSLLVFPAMWIPFIGTSYLRMAEYTCDRMAAYYTGKPETAINGLLILAAGRRLYKTVNLKDYMQQYNDKKGLFVTLTELLSTHPPIPKRIQEIEVLMFETPTVQLIHRSKQVVSVVFVLFLILPAMTMGLIFAGVKVLEEFNFSLPFFVDYNPLMEASIDGNMEEVETLLITGADPNELNEFGESALLFAVIYESPEVIQLLLEYGADPNIQDNYGWTPLMSAVMMDNLEVAELLLNAGADPLLADEDGMSSIDYARDMASTEFVKLLKQYQ